MVKHRVVANAHLGHPGRPRAASIGANMPGWANALFGGWTVSTLFQARSGQQPDPVLHELLHARAPGTRASPSTAWATASAAPGGPTRSAIPTSGGSRDAFFNSGRLRACPAPRQLGNAKKGSLLGPGHLGRQLRVLQGRRRQAALPAPALGPARQRLQPSPVLPRLRHRLRPARQLPHRRRREQRHDGRPGGGRHRATRKASRRGESSA